MQIGGVVGVIKSLQRGLISLSSVSSLNQTIAAVNMAKSNLHILGVNYGGTVLSEVSANIQLTSSTNISAARGISTGACFVSWELVEYY